MEMTTFKKRAEGKNSANEIWKKWPEKLEQKQMTHQELRDTFSSILGSQYRPHTSIKCGPSISEDVFSQLMQLKKEMMVSFSKSYRVVKNGDFCA